MRTLRDLFVDEWLGVTVAWIFFNFLVQRIDCRSFALQMLQVNAIQKTQGAGDA